MSTKTLPCYGSAAEEGGFKGERANSVKMPRLPKTLPAEEKKYLLAVDRGDVAAVTRMIRKAQQDGSLNINCMDPLGRGALLMAIDGENLAMVETLIVNGVRTADALLHAIDKEFVEAVELLLEHEELIHKEGDPYSWENIDRDTATFTPEITPLILASHRNNYEILKILLDRGATLPMPHDFRCTCHACVDGVRGDSLRHSASRINSYKALASPSLIALTSTDPLLTSFELSWELKQLAIAEKEFRTDYLELRKQSSDFAVSLLSQTRTSHELEVMLNFDPHNAREDILGFEGTDEGGLARLRLAIKYKQKKFVAHASVQQFLSAMWYEGLPGFRQKSTLGKCIEIVQIIATFPLYCLLYMIAPNSSTAKLMRKPFMKFLTHASSYLFFLFLLILVSQRVEEQVKEFLGGDDGSIVITGQESIFRKKQRGNPPLYLEYFVAIYVLGFIVEETRELFRSGFMSYVSNMWNAIDFLRNLLYCAVFFLRAWAYMDQNREIAIDPEKAYIPREEWDDFDPQLIAEGLFSAANIFSALKLVHVSTINPHLGPLQISLGRMVFDILKFFFFYTLVLFAFACGLNQLLWYFADLERQKCYSLPGGLPDWNRAAESCMKWRRFGNLFESSQSLFWASFGMVGLSDFELTGIKSYTRFWGLLMFGSYCVINVIVLLNLLIAMLSNTYAAIEEKADTEWKFARTKFWLSYFDEDGSLPSPFNLIPTPKSIKRLLTRFIPNLAKIGTSLKKREAKMSELREQAMQYRSVMRALVWRYVSGLQRKSEETVVSEDDINEVKGEISALRCDLVEVFRRNGMNVTSVTQRPVATARKTREWERRLLRGFHVAPAAGDENLDIDPDLDVPEKDAQDSESTKEGGADRFRRMARLALLNRDVVSRPPNHLSHIGKSTSSESFRSRQSLKQAMDEARRMVLGSIQKSPKIQDEGVETSGAVSDVKSQSSKLERQDSMIEESEKKSSSVARAAAGRFSLKEINKHSMETNASATDSTTSSQIQNSVTFSDTSKTEAEKSTNSNMRSSTVKPMKSASMPMKPTTMPANSASRQPLDPTSILKSTETSKVTDKNIQNDANLTASMSTSTAVDGNKSLSAMDTKNSGDAKAQGAPKPSETMSAPGSAKPVEVIEPMTSTQPPRELPDGSGSVSVSIYNPQQIKPDTSVNMDLSKIPVTPTDMKQPSVPPNSSTKVPNSKDVESRPTAYKSKRADEKAPTPNVPVHSKSLTSSVTSVKAKEDARPASEALKPSDVVKNTDGGTASSAKESTASASCKSALRAPVSLDVESKPPANSATGSQTSSNTGSTASLASPPTGGKKSDSQLLLPSIDNVKTIKKSGAWF